MLKGKYLKVKDLFPVYDTGSKVYYDPSLHDEIILKGVNVTVDVDEKLEKLHGPNMARPTTLPCRAYQTLDIEEYTKGIQDEVFEAIRTVRFDIGLYERDKYFRGQMYNDLIHNHKGSEFMAMYEDYQEGAQKEREELQKKDQGSQKAARGKRIRCGKERMNMPSEEENKMDPETAILVLQNLQDWLYFSSMNGGTFLQREAIDIAIAAIEDKLGR